MQCPKCQSQNVLVCSVAHEQGTTTTTTRGTASGTGSGHTMGVAGAFAANSLYQTSTSVNTTSTSRTAFAERCAPPTSTVWWAILATLVMFVIDIGLLGYLDAENKYAGTGTVVMLGILAACVLWLILAIRNRPNYRQSLERWRKTWACASCGNFFAPEE